jgi:hypothetical protein
MSEVVGSNCLDNAWTEASPDYDPPFHDVPQRLGYLEDMMDPPGDVFVYYQRPCYKVSIIGCLLVAGSRVHRLHLMWWITLGTSL